MRNCVEVVELQLLLKTLRIQVDDHVIECIPCFNYFDYSVKVIGPQNYNEIFASNILPTDIDNLPLRDELNHHERLTIHKDPSANEPLHLDVGGKIYYIELRLIKK